LHPVRKNASCTSTPRYLRGGTEIPCSAHAFASPAALQPAPTIHRPVGGSGPGTCVPGGDPGDSATASSIVAVAEWRSPPGCRGQTSRFAIARTIVTVAKWRSPPGQTKISQEVRAIRLIPAPTPSASGELRGYILHHRFFTSCHHRFLRLHPGPFISIGKTDGTMGWVDPPTQEGGSNPWFHPRSATPPLSL
jgi:hypothetical protein